MLRGTTKTLTLVAGSAWAFSLCVIAVSLSSLAAQSPTEAIAVFPPGTTRAEAIAAIDRADAQVMDYGRVGWIIAVAGRSDSLHVDLRQNGAVFLLDSTRAAFLCGAPDAEA